MSESSEVVTRAFHRERQNMEYNLPEKAVSDIVSFAKSNGVEKVILFGSRARGTNAERSDIDLAVRGGDAFNYYYDLEEKARTLLIFDVVNLDKGVTDELKKEIERDGIVLYEKI